MVGHWPAQAPSDPVFYGKTSGTNLSVERALAKLCKNLGAEKEDLHLCYDCHPSSGEALTAKPALAG